MVVYFAGGSLGTAFGATAVDQVGWVTTARVAAAVIVAAAVLTLFARVRSGRAPRAAG
jgi:predicted MFS family arabinose efflux permease